MIIPKVNKTVEQVKIKDILFNEEIYARFEPNQSLISRYEENAEQILGSQNKIQVSENNILIDGYHRLKAFQRVFGEDKEISVLKHHTENRDYIELKSYSANTTHGHTNSKEENRRNISRLYARGFELDKIQQELGLSKSIVYEATKKRREEEKEQQKKSIVDAYLKAWNTQESVADEYGVTHPTVRSIVENVKNSTCGEFYKTFKPYLYNIWNLDKQDNERKHFGAFPVRFMQNVIHYHTEPLDIVYDPFGGGGTTADVCKEMFRRYYVSDRKVIPGREKDIREHDIKDGLPDDLPKPKMVFLDPPYWKQAENKYSEDKTDLANMSLDDFYKSMKLLFDNISDRKIDKIALVISPTQYPNDLNFEDHVFKFNDMLSKYEIEMRYILPYSTQQYNGTQVEIAKERNICLSRNRDLIVWRKK